MELNHMTVETQGGDGLLASRQVGLIGKLLLN